ncbi:MAG: dTDP-4-dehydrorhamnose reductase [Candidatus Absconditabacterales bacterium]|nr:dTDP-4-dehydrorhamnose reductase [Candidatus Absconditabacterales bacterium]
MNKTILITGSNGMLGTTFRQHQLLEDRGYKVIYTNRNMLDITNLSECHSFFASNHIHTIINCAAYTNVEKAEDEEKIPNYQVNTLGSTNLALCAAQHNIRLIHISTDYVFDGSRIDGNNENDTCGPLNHYGLAKWLGEENILRICGNHGTIVRTSWLYGGGKEFKNFVNTMLLLGQTKPELRVIDDQRGAPTYTGDLVHAITELIQRNTFDQPTYHFCNHTPEGGITWYDFAQQIFLLTQNSIPVHPIPSSDYPTKAIRPRHSHLINNSNIILPDRKNGLQTYLTSLQVIT